MGIQTLKMFARPVSAEDERSLLRVIRLGNLYYRNLALIENRRRQEIRALGAQFEGIGDLVQRLRDLPAEERKGEVGDALRAEIDAAAKRRRKDPAYRESVAQIIKRHEDEKRSARGASGLAPGAWGTYQHVEQAHDMACESTHWGEDVDPHVSLDCGAIAVHAQGDRIVTTPDLFESAWGFAQIDPEPYALGRSWSGFCARSAGPGDWGPSHSHDRPPAPRMRELRIRCDSTGRAPVWSRLHLLIPDEIPAGRVLWVRVHRHRSGLRHRWSAHVVLDRIGPVRAPRPTGGIAGEIVGVDLRCGRRVEGGHLLAHAVGDDGAQHSLIIPDVRVVQHPTRTESHGCVDASGKIDSIRSIRDRTLLEVAREIRAFCDQLPEAHSLREEAKFSHLWKRWGRVATFARRLQVAIDLPSVESDTSARVSQTIDPETPDHADTSARVSQTLDERMVDEETSALAKSDVVESEISARVSQTLDEADDIDPDAFTRVSQTLDSLAVQQSPALDPLRRDPEAPPDPIPESLRETARAFSLHLEARLKQDRHLYHWESSQREKLVRRTIGRIRQWCAMLAERYEAIAFEDLSIKKLKEQPGILGKIVARGVQDLGPGRVREIAQQAAHKRARVFLKVDARGTTRDCDRCGHPRAADLAPDLVACERCGHESPPWVTAANNILARARVDLASERAALLAREEDPAAEERRRKRRTRKKVATPAAGDEKIHAED